MAKVATPGESANLTFSPKIDERSKRLVAASGRAGRSSVFRAGDSSLLARSAKTFQYVPPPLVPVESPRASATVGGDKQLPRYSFDSQLTFCPRLNENSLRLAAGGGRVARLIQHPDLLKRPDGGLEPSTFTFSPRVSEKSLRIAEGLDSTFLSRQQAAVERRRLLEEMGKTMSCGMNSCSPGGCTTGLSHPQQQRAAQAKSLLSERLQKCASTPNLVPASKSSVSPEKLQYTPGNLLPLHKRHSGESPREKPNACRKLLFSRHSTDKDRGTSCRTKKRPKTSLSFAIAKVFPSAFKMEPNCVDAKKSLQKPIRQETDENIDHPSMKCSKQASPSKMESQKDLNLNDTVQITMTPVKKHSSPPKRSPSTKPPSPGKNHGPMMRKPESSIPVNIERVRKVKQIAEQAMKQKHVFSIYGPYPILRYALRQRGWLEKEYKCLHSLPKPSKESKQAADNSDDGDDDECVDEPVLCHEGYEKMLKDDEEEWSMLSRAVRNSEQYFIFAAKKDAIDFKYLQRDQLVNHFLENHAFTTKVGLCKALRQLPGFRDTDVNMFFPRCYLLSCEEEKDEFIDDYYLTAAISILKSFVSGKNDPSPVSRTILESEGSATNLEKATNSNSLAKAPVERETSKGLPTSQEKLPPEKMTKMTTLPQLANRKKQTQKCQRVPAEAIELSLHACHTHLLRHHHEDIDEPEEKLPTLSEVEWQKVVQYLYQLTHHHGVIFGAERHKAEAADLLYQLEEILPQFKMDGIRNVWILKPGAKSRGRGISCVDQLEDILQVVRTPLMKEGKWIVQKYIERPLLVHQTKFDIRQWFLVTDWNPLTMWFYRDCYLRFCTQPYTLDDLDSSVHLCNVSVQKNFETSVHRSSKLPDDNIWSSDEFIEFLTSEGHTNVWPTIYEGMKEAIISALLCSQDIIETRKNSFELFGADFMLTEDLHPWLIEINCSPAMSPSARVTARLCAAVLEDTVKVVIDRRTDKNSDVGAFELAFKQAAVEVPQYVGAQLELRGQQMFSIKRKQG